MVETPVKSGFLQTEGGGGHILDFRGGGGGKNRSNSRSTFILVYVNGQFAPTSIYMGGWEGYPSSSGCPPPPPWRPVPPYPKF